MTSASKEKERKIEKNMWGLIFFIRLILFWVDRMIDGKQLRLEALT